MRTARTGGRRRTPEWLAAALRPNPGPVPWPAAVRACVGVAGPLALGFALDRPAYGALAGIGAQFAVINDTADSYRMRVLGIAVPQLAGAVGVVIGAAVFGHGALAVGVVTAVGLASGLISSIGPLASAAALLLLINTIIEAGLPVPGPVWLAPALFLGGGAFVLLLSLLAWPLRGAAPERAAVAAAYRAVADQLAAAGGDGYETRRQATTRRLDHAHDLVLARRAGERSQRSAAFALLARLDALTPLLEAAPAAHHTGRPLPAAVPAAVRALADTIEGRPPAGGAGDPPPAGREAGRAERAVETALRYTASVVRGGEAAPGDRLGRPAPLPVRGRRAARTVLRSGAARRYGLRLALCVGIAQTLVSVVPVPRSYWVALTVAFVLKPDMGSVFSRAVMRAIGTVLGLGVAAAVLAAAPYGWWSVVLMAVLAVLLPVMAARGYAYQTTAITPLILLLSDVLNHQGFGLLLPRLVDSFIGCAIALVVGYLLWPESWHARVGDRLAAVIADAAGYAVICLAPGTAPRQGTGSTRAQGPAGAAAAGDEAPARARRRLYRELSAVRAEFRRAMTEPRPTSTLAAEWWPLVVAVERVVDAIIAAQQDVGQGAPPPPPAEVRAVENQLLELAAGVRAHMALPRVAAEHGPEDSPVLHVLREQVRAARAVATSESAGRRLGPGRRRGPSDR
ncbi:FUSC family protein [Streptomyces sp. 8L]|uniref:FUSC family protein n=1 Tax=Streptomyces sp. 8L TaxID=2877242 RepID=UPI001CD574FF|nr:FUSC family protein [Streptomyces sp. 8L]MCA1220776.1 FUSC family protein [Streptomyces sp. 8L]